MKIYGINNNVYDAVDALIEHGAVAVQGTKTPAVDYANRIIECLSPYKEIEPSIGYQNVANEGYLYYVYDANRYSSQDAELVGMINQIDAAKYEARRTSLVTVRTESQVMDDEILTSDIDKIKSIDSIRVEKGYKPGWTYYQARKKGLLKAYKEFKKNNQRLLTIELVPQTCWFSNVRSVATKKQWGALKQLTFSKAKHICEICSGRGPKWPVECHEVWEFNDIDKIQKLVGLTALCPDCHEVKHIGFANTQGRGEIAVKHLAKVNGWSRSEADRYIDQQFEVWKDRSKYQWELDITYLENHGIHFSSHERKSDETERAEHTEPPPKEISETPIQEDIDENKEDRKNHFFRRLFSRWFSFK